MSTKLQKALEALNELIAEGWEYPDAEWNVSYTQNVDYKKLRQAYDEQEQTK